MSLVGDTGFYVRYGWNEPTFIAAALADFASSLGLSCSFCTPMSVTPGVHEVWDKRVRSHPFAEWASACGTIIWGHHDPSLLRRVAGKKKNILICLRSMLDIPPEELQIYDIIVCFNLVDLKYLETVGEFKSLRYLPVDVPGEFNCVADSTDLRVTCILEPATSRARGPQAGLLLALGMFLDADPDVELDLLTFGNWPLSVREAVVEIQQRHPDKLLVRHRPTALERRSAYARSACLFSFGTRDSSGYFALESMYCGRPVVALDYEPFRSLISDTKFGWMFPATMCRDGNGKPIAAHVNHCELYQGLKDNIEDLTAIEPTRGLGLPEILNARRVMVRKAWTQLLEV